MRSPTDLADRLDTWLWSDRLEDLPPGRRRLVRTGRLTYAVGRDLAQGHLSLQAMSLVYTTLLSLVPLLAVSFSVLKGFGVHNQLEPLLLQSLAALGDKAAPVAAQIVGFVDNTNVGVLGSLGLAILLYTVISLIAKIEQAFNSTWRTGRGRSFAQRFSRYLSVIFVGPVLFFSAVGLSASVAASESVRALLAVEPFGTLIELAGQAIPYLLLAFAFAFVYVFVPNTDVRVRSALVGALVAALLWQAVSWGFARFMVGSTRYAAIYSGLAIPILFMIWVYVAWLILLIGASIAFYHQHPEYLARRERELRLSGRLTERLALAVAAHVVRAWRQGERAWTTQRLACALAVPEPSLKPVLDALEGERILVREEGDPPGWLPARDPAGVPVKTVLDAVRCLGEREETCRGAGSDWGVGAVEARVEGAVAEALAGESLADLADRLGEADLRGLGEPSESAGA